MCGDGLVSFFNLIVQLSFQKFLQKGGNQQAENRKWIFAVRKERTQQVQKARTHFIGGGVRRAFASHVFCVLREGGRTIYVGAADAGRPRQVACDFDRTILIACSQSLTEG